VLDPTRILVGSTSNFGAPLAIGVGKEGSFLSIDPSRTGVLNVPSDFANGGLQASTLGGAVQMFSANSPNWLNRVNNLGAATKQYAGVSNPLGLSNNNGFGRTWPANAPFGLDGIGSSSILDPTGRPLAKPPNSLIGGVYVGNLTNRNAVTTMPNQPQVIPGGLNRGAVGTALLGPSPDATCKAVFAVVTADGAIVQERTLKGLDGLAPAGTVRPILGVTSGPSSNQVFNATSMTRIASTALSLPVDLTPVERDQENVNRAGNATLDQNSDFYVANQDDNTIVRMQQNGTVVAIRRVIVNGQPLDNVTLNGIAASVDAPFGRV
jgi:hypothetical protein